MASWTVSRWRNYRPVALAWVTSLQALSSCLLQQIRPPLLPLLSPRPSGRSTSRNGMPFGRSSSTLSTASTLSSSKH
ncbi:hypothetical protein BKA70DRAFT_1332612 [Coprinopsis sp. MPI-PUGE-AT-0042]|nr:hypothetical protein BKA70DRAFT_1332612 [Coprinopsis sp. MPI-PUGE-AT-0042]